MAIRVYTRFLEADSVEEFEAVYRTFKEDDFQCGASGFSGSDKAEDAKAQKENTLEEAKEVALLKKERYESFTFDDVGIPAYRRSDRKALRDWAELNGIEVWQGNTPGVRGFQGTIFRPLRMDGNGHAIPAECPPEGQI